MRARASVTPPTLACAQANNAEAPSVSGNAGPDHIYKFTASTTGSVRVSTCGSQFNTHVNLYHDINEMGTTCDTITNYQENYYSEVAFCNEFASLCATLGVEYGAVRKHAAVDARIGLSHTAVPGPDGMTGYGGTCFPKDTRGLIGVFDQHRVRCPLLEASVKRNETIDRPGREWLTMVGRAVSERDEASTSDSV